MTNMSHFSLSLFFSGRRKFALKKVQPWNSVKVTFDIPKEAADRLRLLAVQGNVRLIELGILSVEIVGQSNAIVVTNNNANVNPTTTPTPPTTTNSINRDLPVPSKPAAATTSEPPGTSEVKHEDHHRHKRMKVDNEFYSSGNHFPSIDRSISSTSGNLMQSNINNSSGNSITHSVNPYLSSPTSQLHRPPTPSTSNYPRLSSHPHSIPHTHSSYIQPGKVPSSNPILTAPYPIASPMENPTLSNGLVHDMHNYHPHYHHESWSTNYSTDPTNNYKMKVNGIRSNHYYHPGQQQSVLLSDNVSSSSSSSSQIPTTMFCPSTGNPYEFRRCDTNMPPMTNPTTPNTYGNVL